MTLMFFTDPPEDAPRSHCRARWTVAAIILTTVITLRSEPYRSHCSTFANEAARFLT